MRMMKLLQIGVAMAGIAAAFPGMEQALSEVQRKRGPLSTSLIGDLEELSDKDLTRTGRAIKDILTGKGDGQDMSRRVRSMPPISSEACRKDKCCVWKYIADDMRNAMVGSAGRCNSNARQAIRLGFHDAGTWSKKTGRQGGADGSILLARECDDRRENKGLREICAKMREWHDKYKQYGIGVADLIQFSSTVGTVVCPLGPRVRSFIGRKDSHEPSPQGLLPPPTASADALISMFEDKTITPAGLVALVGAHTTSQQRVVDPARAGDPQDSTPGVWDTLYFRETVSKDAPKKVFKFQSDINLANDPRTSGTWQAFSSPIAGQISFNQAYAREYVRLSLLGVYNINELTECTHVLPNFLASFENPDKNKMREYLDGNLGSSASTALMNGDKIPDS
ncbi:hypothetical protein HIM_01329 [Hirsutella minnesotensis 3608]|nr:hypothetical protein HIM_01329 [Hirsutella minnesotensis 3608]